MWPRGGDERQQQGVKGEDPMHFVDEMDQVTVKVALRFDEHV